MKQQPIVHYYSLIFLSLSIPLTLLGVDIGSDSTVTRFNNLQVLSNGDRIAGFAALAGGFELFNAATKATFDSFFGVSGPIRIKNGTLVLNRDLILQDAAQFDSIGNIISNGHIMELAPTATLIQANPQSLQCVILSDIDIILNNDLLLKDVCITFTGDCLIDGRGNCLTIDSTSTLIVGFNSTLAFHDVTLVNVQGNILRCTDATSTVTFKETILELSSNYSFTIGHFDVLGNVEIRGEGLSFIYRSPSVSTIQPEGRLILDYNLTFSYAPTSANRDLINLVDNTAQLILNGNTLFSTTTGLRLTKGDIVIKRDSFLSADGTVAGQGISFGDEIGRAHV